MAEPQISVVVAARNDNHGGNMLARMQAFLDSWLLQSEHLGLASEIVVVEWNPPPDRPRLIDALRKPATQGPCAVRFLEVAPELHGALPNSAAIPLHQMIAKNAGIRRSRGQFVLATNIDLVFSPELMQFLARGALQPGVMYRLDRYDVADAIPRPSAGVDALIEHCRNYMLRVFTAEGTFGVRDGAPRCDEDRDIADPGIGFGRGWNPVEQQDDRHYRWIASEGLVYFERPPSTALAIIAEVGPSNGTDPLTVEAVDASGNVLASTRLVGRGRLLLHFPDSVESGTFTLRAQGRGLPLAPEIRLLHLRVHGLRWETEPDESADWALEVVATEPGTDWAATLQAPSPHAARMHDPCCLHVNAAGDFTLLARDDWFRLRAYPELPIWPVHLDALFCYAAHHAGIREKVLRDPLRMFHIQHGSGAGWTPEGAQALNSRVAALKVPVLDFDADLRGWVQRMRRLNAPVIFNLENWGLAGVELPEREA